MEDMKRLPALSCVSPRKRLAEKFHMSEALLDALNPGKKLDNAGESIMVRTWRRRSLARSRIEVNKTGQTLRAFGPDERLVAFYPVTAGSSEKPAPSGRLKVATVKKNPTCHDDPKYSSSAASPGLRRNVSRRVRGASHNPHCGAADQSSIIGLC
jgi:lipoprotein-anchoring transpeptidase ErfK/SrfK